MQLTEQMILVRAKHSSMDTVKELNLCGYNLTDVSVVRKLTHIEVLALSVNNISSLAPFRECRNLRELYLRRNNIDDIGQLVFLRDLPFLRNLWLIENPFCMLLGSDYRAAVVNILPHLQVLDNIAVTREDIEQSKVFDNWHVDIDLEEIEDSHPIPSNALPHKDFNKDANREERSNVLSAILVLVKDLDLNGLEALQSNIDDRINNFSMGKR